MFRRLKVSYQKAIDVLPQEMIELIQKYIDGEYLYIPRKAESKKAWGEETQTRSELENRNQSIYRDYQNGKSVKQLAEHYFLSEKSIQRIVREYKKTEAA